MIVYKHTFGEYFIRANVIMSISLYVLTITNQKIDKYCHISSIKL